MAISFVLSTGDITKSDSGLTTDQYNTVNVNRGYLVLLFVRSATEGTTAADISSITNDAAAHQITWNLVRRDTAYNSSAGRGVSTSSSIYYGYTEDLNKAVNVTVTYDRTVYISSIAVGVLSGANVLLPDVDGSETGNSTTVNWPSVTMIWPSFYYFYGYVESFNSTDSNTVSQWTPTTGTSRVNDESTVIPSIPNSSRWGMQVDFGWDSTMYTAPGTIDLTPAGTLDYTNTWITQAVIIYDASGGRSDVFGGVLF